MPQKLQQDTDIWAPRIVEWCKTIEVPLLCLGRGIVSRQCLRQKLPLSQGVIRMLNSIIPQLKPLATFDNMMPRTSLLIAES